jgi:hypothetical protein
MPLPTIKHPYLPQYWSNSLHFFTYHTATLPPMSPLSTTNCHIHCHCHPGTPTHWQQVGLHLPGPPITCLIGDVWHCDWAFERRRQNARTCVWQLTLWQWLTVAVAHSGCVAVDAVAVAGGAVAAVLAAFRMAWIGRVLREIWSREWLWLDAVAVAWCGSGSGSGCCSGCV